MKILFTNHLTKWEECSTSDKLHRLTPPLKMKSTLCFKSLQLNVKVLFLHCVIVITKRETSRSGKTWNIRRDKSRNKRRGETRNKRKGETRSKPKRQNPEQKLPFNEITKCLTV